MKKYVICISIATSLLSGHAFSLVQPKNNSDISLTTPAQDQERLQEANDLARQAQNIIVRDQVRRQLQAAQAALHRALEQQTQAALKVQLINEFMALMPSAENTPLWLLSCDPEYFIKNDHSLNQIRESLTNDNAIYFELKDNPDAKEYARTNLPRLLDVIGRMQFLKDLVLNNFSLKHIPSGIFKLKELSYLHMENNLITVIPDEISNLANLTEVSFGTNRLIHVSPELFRLQFIFTISLQKNRLQFLPATLRECALDGSLSIAGNRFSARSAHDDEMGLDDIRDYIANFRQIHGADSEPMLDIDYEDSDVDENDAGDDGEPVAQAVKRPKITE